MTWTRENTYGPWHVVAADSMTKCGTIVAAVPPPLVSEAEPEIGWYCSTCVRAELADLRVLVRRAEEEHAADLRHIVAEGRNIIEELTQERDEAQRERDEYLTRR